MPRNKFTIALAGAMGVLVGCGSQEPAVFVDLSAGDAIPIVAWNEVVPAGDTVTQTQSVLRSLPEASLSEIEHGPLRAAWDEELARQRELSYERTRKILEKRLLAKARSDEASRLKALEPLRNEIISQALERARVIFEQYAEPIGILRVKLANRVGVPTPQSNAPRVRRPWFPATDREVADLKAQIARLEGAYRSDLIAVLDQASAEADRLIAGARIATAMKEDEALQEARRIVQELRRKASQSRTIDSVADRSFTVPASPSASAPVTSVRGRDSRFSAVSNLNAEARDALRQQAMLWAKRNGWRLVDDPRATDKTKEFWKWREKYLAGSLGN